MKTKFWQERVHPDFQTTPTRSTPLNPHTRTFVPNRQTLTPKQTLSHTPNQTLSHTPKHTPSLPLSHTPKHTPSLPLNHKHNSTRRWPRISHQRPECTLLSPPVVVLHQAAEARIKNEVWILVLEKEVPAVDERSQSLNHLILHLLTLPVSRQSLLTRNLHLSNQKPQGSLSRYLATQPTKQSPVNHKITALANTSLENLYSIPLATQLPRHP